MRLRFLFTAIFLCMLLIGGCSGANTPVLNLDETNITRNHESDSQRILLGMWDIHFNQDEMRVEVEPLTRILDADVTLHFTISSQSR